MRYDSAVFTSFADHPGDPLFRAAYADVLEERGQNKAATLVRSGLDGIRISQIARLCVITTKRAWVLHGGLAFDTMGTVFSLHFIDAEPINAGGRFSWRMDDGKWDGVDDDEMQAHVLSLLPPRLFVNVRQFTEDPGDNPWLSYNSPEEAKTALIRGAYHLWGKPC